MDDGDLISKLKSIDLFGNTTRVKDDNGRDQSMETLRISQPGGKNTAANKAKKERMKRKKKEERKKELDEQTKVAHIIEIHKADADKFVACPVEISLAPGKRLGMFATKDIAIGTMIFKEPGLVIGPRHWLTIEAK